MEGELEALLFLRGMIDILSALKFPRQCPLVLLVKVDYREVKALGSVQFCG
jgi:hypothetical protein